MKQDTQKRRNYTRVNNDTTTVVGPSLEEWEETGAQIYGHTIEAQRSARTFLATIIDRSGFAAALQCVVVVIVRKKVARTAAATGMRMRRDPGGAFTNTTLEKIWTFPIRIEI